MIKLTSEADQVCVAKANEAGQEHIFDGWDDLPAEAQRSLIAEAQKIDFQLVKRLVHEHVHSPAERQASSRVLKPIRPDRLPSLETDREEFELSRTLGEYALRNREVLLVTAAGGSCPGSLSEPVGTLPVGPITGKSLFQLHAEKVQALNRRYRTSLRWTIVCHPEEREKVAAFFKANAHFGLPCSDLCITEQDLLPVVDRRGKIILCGPGRMAMSPNGHGGVILRLLDEGRLEAMESAGIRHIFYFQVDNPLVFMADPVFLGYHIKNQCEASAKAVQRTDPHEKVGVFCEANGHSNGAVRVVEHTELSAEEREARLSDGTLALVAANIGVHVFSLDFLLRLREEGIQLPFHPVDRVTPCWSRRGKAVRPAEAHGVKFVTYAFDALRCAKRTRIVEVPREAEFSPIKHATGPVESPETAQRDLSRLHAGWLKDVMPRVDLGQGAGAEPLVEISPLYALDAEELREKLAEKGEVPVPGAAGGILLGGRS